MITVIVLIAMVLILPIPVIGWATEKERYNGGVCKKNGLTWVYFDTDSQGGRGYKAGDQYCWVSWWGID